MSISDISGTANKYCSQLKECLRNSAISTLEQINRKCATLVSKTIVPLSEKVAKARMWEDYRMLRRIKTIADGRTNSLYWRLDGNRE